MGTPVQLSASSSASSGPSASGGIGAGESFDIGGINFGYQPQTATASGSLPTSNTGSSGIPSALGGAVSGVPVWLIAGLVFVGVYFFVLRKR